MAAGAVAAAAGAADCAAVGASLAESSGDTALDAAAVAMVVMDTTLRDNEHVRNEHVRQVTFASHENGPPAITEGP